MKNETIELLVPFIREATPVGSRVTCDPAPTDTDNDILVLLNEHDPASAELHPVFALETLLKEAGWVLGGSRPDNALDDKLPACGSFSSYTKGEENLIVAGDDEFYRRFLAATKVSKRLNLLDKSDRIALFQAVLYGNTDSNIQLTHFEIHMFPVHPADDLDDLI